MNVLDERLVIRAADKAQALGEIAAVLAMMDAAKREPETWERLSLLRAFAFVAVGCYGLALLEARDASLAPTREITDLLAEPVLARCDLMTMFAALREAMAEAPRLYPHVGPTALA